MMSSFVNLVEIGLGGYDVKPRFWRSNVNIANNIHFFFGEKNLVALDTYAKKMNPSSIVWGGVHGKVSWPIAYS